MCPNHRLTISQRWFHAPNFFPAEKKDPIPKNDSGFFLVERVCFDLSTMMGIFLVERHVNLQGGGNST